MPIGCINPEIQDKPIPKSRAKKQQKYTTHNKEETELKQQNDAVDLHVDISDIDSDDEDDEDVKVPVQRTPIEISKVPLRVVEEEVIQPERKAVEDPAP